MSAIGLSPALLRFIAEAVTWCSYKPFRSPELDPSAILSHGAFSSDSSSIQSWIEKRVDRYARALAWINEQRAQLLAKAKLEIVDPAHALSTSKLLIHEHLETVEDGASEAASMGFYDLQDAPPWDTWFLYAGRKVFCCIPDGAISHAQAGIDMNPVDCIRWEDWSKLHSILNRIAASEVTPSATPSAGQRWRLGSPVRRWQRKPRA